MQNETQEITESQFTKFALSDSMMKALKSMKFTEPTPIQEKTIPLLIEKSCDIVALAETGSGKTVAYGIPLIEKIDADIRDTQALILCPTRELAMQVSEQIQKLGQFKKLTVATIYGGASYLPQESALRKGAQVIVATPGRLLDFLEQKKAKLGKVETIVLDEADEMISLGFKDALEEILGSIGEAQRWLFSATMNKQIREIASKYLTNPEQVLINKSGDLPSSIEQVYYPIRPTKRVEALLRVMQANNDFYGIIFCQTKLEVDQVSEALTRQGLFVEAFHGDRTQKERERILKKFRDKTITALVATDVAARGLDVKDLTHVINFTLPWDEETYVHRIGRTGRSGKKGIAISLVSSDQIRKLEFIRRKTGRPLIKKEMPTAEDVIKTKLSAMLEKIFAVTANATELRMKDYIGDIAREKSLDLESLSREELFSRLVTKEMSYWLRAEREDQDKLISVDKDLEEFENGRGGGGGGERGGYRGRRGAGSRGGAGAARGGDRERRGAGGGGGGKKFFRKRRSRD